MSQIQQGENAIVRNVLDGVEEIVCHPGTHQYSDGGLFGVSACGLAALNFARVIFEKRREHRQDVAFLQAIITGQTVKEITDICKGWSSDVHLDVEDIYRVPLFDKSLNLVSTKYGHPSLDQFTGLLRNLRAIHTCSVAIITRPPEIIACMKLVINAKDIFVIFDSHSRPNHPGGAGFILNTSIHRTAARLNEMMPVDSRLLSEGNLEWQAQLLTNYSSHIFVSKGPDNSSAHLMQTVIESSLALLASHAEISDLKSRNSTLASESNRIQAEMDQMESENREERKRILRLFRTYESRSSLPASTSDQATNAVAGPSRIPQESLSRPPAYSPRLDENVQPPMHGSSSNGQNGYSMEQSADEFAVAGQVQLNSLDPERESADTAAQMQREFDEEDRHLRAQMEVLIGNLTRKFCCSVCLDEQPEDFVARLDPCGHNFCRDCIRNHIGSKIAESRYPILCPVCMTETREGDPGVVTDFLVQQIGVTEAQYKIWIELEMAQFSALVHCRKCKRSTVVDRQDLETTAILACPLPDCSYMWCKACQQEITAGGPQHSCDGTSELDNLMKALGWRYCPNCRTPFQKDSGCNHMTCPSPGCNTHFCYGCGKLIIRSALTKNVSSAITAHYKRCAMYGS